MPSDPFLFHPIAARKREEGGLQCVIWAFYKFDPQSLFIIKRCEKANHRMFTSNIYYLNAEGVANV